MRAGFSRNTQDTAATQCVETQSPIMMESHPPDLFLSPWIAAARSDAGPVRPHNEDAWLAWSEAPLWAVADGMGGHADGAVASETVIEELSRITPCANLQAMEKRIAAALTLADRTLKSRATDNPLRVSGSTVVVLTMVQGMASVIWAGDSRLYHDNGERFSRITRDHTQAFDYIEAGLLTEREARLHPSASVLTRAIGGVGPLRLSTLRFPVSASDRFLLCSDGLSNVLPVEVLASEVQGSTPQQCVDVLVEASLALGARDNVTALCVHGQVAGAA